MYIKIPLKSDTQDCFSVKADAYETVGMTREAYDKYAKEGNVEREILWGNVGDVTVLHVHMPVKLVVAFDGVAYVCNNEGQTMEKIKNKGFGHLRKIDDGGKAAAAAKRALSRQKGADAVAEERGLPRVIKPDPNPPEVR